MMRGDFGFRLTGHGTPDKIVRSFIAQSLTLQVEYEPTSG